MKYSFLTLLIVTSAVLMSFFLGYMYALREYELQYEKIFSQPQYIDVSSSKQKINIENMPKNVFFRIDGQVIQSGGLNLQ